MDPQARERLRRIDSHLAQTPKESSDRHGDDIGARGVKRSLHCFIVTIFSSTDDEAIGDGHWADDKVTCLHCIGSRGHGLCDLSATSDERDNFHRITAGKVMLLVLGFGYELLVDLNGAWCCF